ncbi:MAG: transposase [Flavobacteriales bacterium]|nr:transposase [Flavobacteriales bacterium]
MRTIHKAPNMQEAEAALETFAIGWEKRYPRVVESWRSNWPRLSSFLRYPEPIRRMMYTTNIIEGYHAQLRKVTKTKRVFDGDKALLKLLYLVQQRIANEQWANPLLNWRTIYLSIEILFKDRLTHLD